jgi:hypothetical protein
MSLDCFLAAILVVLFHAADDPFSFETYHKSLKIRPFLELGSRHFSLQKISQQEDENRPRCLSGVFCFLFQENKSDEFSGHLLSSYL